MTPNCACLVWKVPKPVIQCAPSPCTGHTKTANRHGPWDPRLQRSLIPHDLAFLLAPGSPSSPGFHSQGH